MNGAECLVQTLINSDVKVCFLNPGTTEIDFVAATDKIKPIFDSAKFFLTLNQPVRRRKSGLGTTIVKLPAALPHQVLQITGGMATPTA